MKHIVSFSGGKDSTAMLLMMIEKEMKIDEIIFLDTGVEFPEMYKHIEKVEKHINRKITVLKNEKGLFEYFLLEHIKSKGKNKGQKGYSWAGVRSRWCTSKLKSDISQKYLKKFNNEKIKLYQGIAADEIKRLEKKSGESKNVEISYPLAEWGITEKEALKYCYNKSFNWNGLYKKFNRVSCWCCPLQPLKSLRTLYKEYPKYWEKLKEWDSKTYRKFRADYSILELEKKFEKEVV